MASPILMLPGKVNASNALVVTGGTGTTTTPAGGPTAIANLQGLVDASNRLIVVVV